MSNAPAPLDMDIRDFAREMFETLDIDGDGEVNVNELKAAVEAVETATNARSLGSRVARENQGLAGLALKILQEIGTARKRNGDTVSVGEVEQALKKVFDERPSSSSPAPHSEAEGSDSRVAAAPPAAGAAAAAAAAAALDLPPADAGAGPAAPVVAATST